MVQLGNLLEDGLTKDHMATNAETWRHIWFVQRFIQHGIKAVMEGVDGNCIIGNLNDVHLNPNQAKAMAPQGDLGAIVKNTYAVFKSKDMVRSTQYLDRERFTVHALLDRCISHDQSKLVDPEVHTFVEVTPKLKKTVFNSPDYNAIRNEMKPALDNHYARNRHHPEHYEHGVRSMTLIDVLEMLCDWLASSLRQPEGCIEKSIHFCQERFGFDDGLADALRATVKRYYETEYRRNPSEFYQQIL